MNLKRIAIVLGFLILIPFSFLVWVRVVNHIALGTPLFYNTDSFKVINKGLKEVEPKENRRVLIMALDLASYHLEILCDGQSHDSIKTFVEMDRNLLETTAITKEKVSLSELLNLNVSEVFDTPIHCSSHTLLYKQTIDSVRASYRKS